MRALLLVVFAACVLASAPACDREGGGGGAGEVLPSVRLGMTPRDVRDRFQPGGQGTWQSRVGSGDDTSLEWTAHEPGARVPSARFEFHLGMLVAVRARVTDAAKGERVETTARTVTWTRPSAEGGTDIVVLARDCPTHKEESDALVARAR